VLLLVEEEAEDVVGDEEGGERMSRVSRPSTGEENSRCVMKEISDINIPGSDGEAKGALPQVWSSFAPKSAEIYQRFSHKFIAYWHPQTKYANFVSYSAIRFDFGHGLFDFLAPESLFQITHDRA
jgi:hypothetical protein